MPERPNLDYHPSNAEHTRLQPAPTPLAIILTIMHRKYADGDLDGAVALARIAAPYLHPRVPAASLPTDLAALSDAELDAFPTRG